MAVIALNWELGADLGHIGRFLPIALRLREQGHRPVMLLSDIARAAALLEPHGLEYLQAPVWSVEVGGLPADLNHTETLFRFGFLHPEGLWSMCRAWRAVWALLRPDAMIFDYAPTALLAARGLGVPRIVIGNTFAIPPQARPMPRYRWWTDGTSGERVRMEETEQRATRNANAVLARLGARPVRQVSELYEAEATLICADPALDVYGARAGGQYIGAINNIETGLEPVWPLGSGAQVFAYLKPAHKHFEACLQAMARSDGRFLVFAPGMAEQQMRRHATPRLVFSKEPLRMREVAQQCTAMICHGGGVTDVALEAGKPVLLLPGQLEQTMTSQRVVALGAGVFMPLDGNPAQLPKLLKQLLTDTGLADRAGQYAQGRSPGQQTGALDQLIGVCQSCLAQTPAAQPTPHPTTAG